MSLGLVNYDDSEESDNDEDYKEKNENTTLNGLSHFNGKKEIKLDPSFMTEKSKNLPLPESKLSLVNTDIDIKCLTSSNKRSGPVKIAIPSLSQVDQESEPPSRKRIKPSQKGSGLFALLPSPKSTLVPNAVISKKQNVQKTNKNPNLQAKPVNSTVNKLTTKLDVNKQKSLINYEDSGDEDEPVGTDDFFSLESKEKEEIITPLDVNINFDSTTHLTHHTEEINSRIDPSDVYRATLNVPQSPHSLPCSTSSDINLSSDQYTTSDFISVSKNDLELDHEAMQQLCGRRDRLKMEEVNIIDVSGDAIMPDSREWLTKQLTEEQNHRPSHKRKDGPTTQQKRKHQITYLAFQAKENEFELKNQWANNRMSRKQTQAKYGF